MNVVEEHYLIPMEKNKALCSAEDIKGIFSNFRAIRDLHTHFLKELQLARENVADIAKAFKKNASFFRIYIEYCNNFSNSAQKLSEKERGRKDFEHFLLQQMEHANMGGLDLHALLIMPVQRLPRYVLLLRELHKQFMENKELQGAIGALEKIADQVNEAKRQSENVERILQIQKRIVGWNMILLQPTRRLLLEFGPCNVTGKRCVVFAFTDLVLACMEMSNDFGGPLQYLSHCQINNQSDLTQNVKEAVLNRGELKIDFQNADDANNFSRIMMLQIQSSKKHEEVESQIDDTDALLPAVWEGWMEKESTKVGAVRFLSRYVQLRGNTLFWFNEQKPAESPGIPSGSYSVAQKLVFSAEKEKGLPNTIKIMGNQGEASYFFRNEKKSEMQRFVNALLNTNCTIDQTLQMRYVTDIPGKIDVQFALKLSQKFVFSPQQEVICVVFKEKTAHGKFVAKEMVFEQEGNAWINVRVHRYEVLKVCVYKTALTAREALVRHDFKSASVKKCGNACIHISDLLRGVSLQLNLSLNGGFYVTDNILSLKRGDRFRDHSNVEMHVVGKSLNFKKNSPVFLSVEGMTSDSRWKDVYSSDCIPKPKDSNTVVFGPMIINVVELCNGDFDQPIIFHCLNFIKDGAPKQIGQVKTRMDG